MHVLLCVESAYFKKQGQYIKQSEWVDLWQRALQVDYRPVANIKAIKPNQKGDKDIVLSSSLVLIKLPSSASSKFKILCFCLSNPP